jgi:hypothetical protein
LTFQRISNIFNISKNSFLQTMNEAYKICDYLDKAIAANRIAIICFSPKAFCFKQIDMNAKVV